VNGEIKGPLATITGCHIQLLLYDADGSLKEAISPFSNAGVPTTQCNTISELETKLRLAATPSISVITGSERDRQMLSDHVREIERINHSRSGVPVRTLVVLTAPGSPRFVHDLRALGAETIIYSRPETNVQQILTWFRWEFSRQRQILPTIRVLFSGSEEATVTLIGSLSQVELIYRGKLLDLFQALDHRWRTKKYLADRAEISLSSLNEYIKRRRDEFDAKRRDAGVLPRAKDVFQCKKLSGAWLYRMMANIVYE
jgi:hypothetical protein